jgi:hypothetical protein
VTQRIPRRSGREAGFALAETLVAALIVAAMMGLTYQSIAANAQAERMIAERREAVMIAQSVLAEASGPASDAGPAQGRRRGKLSWRIASAPYSAGERQGGPPLERVTVNIYGERPNVPILFLDTLRLGR